jgi:hypothetical protein
MARERVIHDRHCGTSSAAAPAPEPPAAAQSLDDMLF